MYLLKSEVATPHENDRNLALIMADIDSFKLFNDTYGHVAGDQCLVQVAEILKRVVDSTEALMARFGGEEFVVLLSDTTEATAAAVAEEMRLAIEQADIENPGTSSPLTVSLGVAAIVPKPGSRTDDLIKAADKALYHAKKSGRNRVVSQSSIS